MNVTVKLKWRKGGKEGEKREQEEGSDGSVQQVAVIYTMMQSVWGDDDDHHDDEADHDNDTCMEQWSGTSVVCGRGHMNR